MADVQGPRVLLVEDDEAFAAFLTAALAGSPTPVHLTAATDLASALQHVRDDAVDAVLLDLNLPDSEGLATLGALVALAPHLPIVVLTGLDDGPIAGEALRLGAEDWLVKAALDP